MDNKLYFSVHVKDKGGRLYTNENGKLIGAFKLEIPNMPLDSKLKFKVKADIGDGEGGGYYHIASFNSIALALIFINGLKPMFGFNLGVMRDTLGIPKSYSDLKFKGVILTRRDNERIEEFY